MGWRERQGYAGGERSINSEPRLLGDGTRLYDVADGSVRKLQNLRRR